MKTPKAGKLKQRSVKETSTKRVQGYQIQRGAFVLQGTRKAELYKLMLIRNLGGTLQTDAYKKV
jgi:hypothetical protein